MKENIKIKNEVNNYVEEIRKDSEVICDKAFKGIDTLLAEDYYGQALQIAQLIEEYIEALNELCDEFNV